MSDSRPPHRARLTPADIRAHLDGLTKPPGSLGRLEDLAARLCAIQQTLEPRTRPRRLVLFAADHGVVQAGVTAWPSAVTGLMIANIVGGGAASSVLAAECGAELRLVDVGSVSDPLVPLRPEPGRPEPGPPEPSYRVARVGAGTRNLAEQPAMTAAELEAAVAEGRREAEQAAAHGVQVLATGEMGIGNTTAAACLGCLLTGAAPPDMVGRGAGADDATLARKLQVVTRAVQRARTDARAHAGTDAGTDARADARADARGEGSAEALFERSLEERMAALAGVCGFEIAAMAGLYEAGAEQGLTLVVDGFIATAAALLAESRRPGTATQMIAAHCSAETGHARMLESLGLPPLLDWGLRLGEGTGALLAMPLLDAAATMVGRMATFAEAGIAAE
jgi:nicotinate-nucleotide--dimethylbenzimidazole phosphoribosyltransferase